MFTISQYGMCMDNSKYEYDETLRMFSTSENGIVLDFSGAPNTKIVAGNSSTIISGHRTNINVGVCSVIKSGDDSIISAGNNSTIYSGWYCKILATHDCRINVGLYSTILSGDDSIISSGIGANIKSGCRSVVKSGHRSTIVVGDNSNVISGVDSIITTSGTSSLTYYQKDGSKWNIKNAIISGTVKIDENGILLNTEPRIRGNIVVLTDEQIEILKSLGIM